MEWVQYLVTIKIFRAKAISCDSPINSKTAEIDHIVQKTDFFEFHQLSDVYIKVFILLINDQ